jgi:hypothetical protein
VFYVGQSCGFAAGSDGQAALPWVPGRGSGLLRRARYLISALVMEPAQASDQLGGEFEAIRVYFKTPLIDLAQPGNNVQISTRCLGEKDVSAIVFYLFETAEAALVAERFPCLFIIIVVIHLLYPASFSIIINFPQVYSRPVFQSSCC